jgi:hypothetical protein
MVAYTLQQFVSTVKGDGLARANLFGVSLTLPPLLSSHANFTNQVACLYANKASIPGSNIEVVDIQNYGEQIHRPKVRSYKQQFSIEFYLDSGYNIKQLFELLVNLVINQNSKMQSYLDDFIGTISVYGNRRDTTTAYSINMHDAYPISVSDISFTSEAGGQILGIRVEFSYRNFTFAGSDGFSLQAAAERYLSAINAARNIQEQLQTGNYLGAANLGLQIPTDINQLSQFTTT